MKTSNILDDLGSQKRTWQQSFPQGMASVNMESTSFWWALPSGFSLGDINTQSVNYSLLLIENAVALFVRFQTFLYWLLEPWKPWFIYRRHVYLFIYLF